MHIPMTKVTADELDIAKPAHVVGIDGTVATIMALDRAIRCGNDTTASVYDDRGILFL